MLLTTNSLVTYYNLTKLFNTIQKLNKKLTVKGALAGLRRFLVNEKCLLFHLKSSSRSQDI